MTLHPPVVSDSMREWAQALVASIQNVAEMRGEPLTPDDVERLIREVRAEFLSAYRYSSADDYEFTRDEGDQDVSGGLADRQAAKEWWRATGGDQ